MSPFFEPKTSQRMPNRTSRRYPGAGAGMGVTVEKAHWVERLALRVAYLPFGKRIFCLFSPVGFKGNRVIFSRGLRKWRKLSEFLQIAFGFEPLKSIQRPTCEDVAYMEPRTRHAFGFSFSRLIDSVPWLRDAPRTGRA